VANIRRFGRCAARSADVCHARKFRRRGFAEVVAICCAPDGVGRLSGHRRAGRLCAGLLGIGGGVVMVPFLVLVFREHGMPPEHVVHIALGTRSPRWYSPPPPAWARTRARRGRLEDRARDVAGMLAGSFAAALVPG